MDKFINKKSVDTHRQLLCHLDLSDGFFFVIFPGFPKNYVLLGSIAARL